MSRLRRLRPLPGSRLPGGVLLLTADSRRARLLGLAGLDHLPPDTALLMPRCRSVHTFGMRFALDLIWLDSAGRVLRQDRAVSPRRVRSCRRATAVVEAGAGDGNRLAAALMATQAGVTSSRAGSPS
ncbi:MAG: hypothetical protein AVDCRST_MAG69-2872 [uncultured Solirubrobacteraceae bacterium]|uniref:DUF192 domain-containing protein n=1 Tax=uncultured Solirubrobacteraceae bacterium TaxID=1162706 RepID=A0A6J4TAP5_9ACTN|nr:MAG: hypothetical protein AVDCRST_MAG69-2872 [uncultured Solirubrobacteraceae bacterium]